VTEGSSVQPPRNRAQWAKPWLVSSSNASTN
jgi:hypothetical protein